MINNEVGLFRENIEQLDVNDEQKKILLQQLKSLEKALASADFKFRRISKDKFIATNLLKTSVEELEKNQTLIEKANKELSRQKKEVDVKNIELRKQKLVVEHQSRQLKTHLKKLEISYKEMEQFTYIASHDLQSPLRTISNFATLLKERYRGKLDHQADEFIDFINKGAKQMSNVINDLLNLSRVGSKNTKFEQVDLVEVVDMVKFNLNKAIEESNTTLVIDCLPSIYMNKSSAIQLFQNLLGNAIKFRSNDRIPCVKVTCEEDPSHWIFNVEDNGVGMDEAFQKKAFQPFQRVNNLDRPGTGIGLAICMKVVKFHGGEIYFKSKEGEGTSFTFTISKTLGNQVGNLIVMKGMKN